MCLIYRLYSNKPPFWTRSKTNKQVKSSCCRHHKSHYILLMDSLEDDKPGLMPRPMCFFLSVSIIAPPQTTIIKRNCGKNCDISHLCIELVVKEMSQWDALSWGEAAVTEVCSASCWGCTVAAIRTLWAHIESREDKDLQHECMVPATFMDFDQKCNVLMFCGRLREKQCGRHILTKSTWQMQYQSLS